MSHPRSLGLARSALFLAGVLLVACGCGTGGQITVASVIDGDTIEVLAGGRLETIRLLGIDTPETVHPTKPPECFGREASELLTSLLPDGTAVQLERDADARDQYGRLLVRVVRVSDGVDVNAAMIESGAARALSIEPNHALRSAYSELEQAARAADRGLWAVCDARE